jgi:hypothetical protein
MVSGLVTKGAVIGLGTLGGGAGIAGGLLAAAKKSADLGESISKVRVVFGRSANGMIDQADELARKFGVVKQSALDAGAGFGLMGRAAGLSQEASSKLGQEMVQLGLDIASFHNISNDEAFEKLRSGLAGEAEPLRPLGILLSEDAVKAEALSMGLVKVKRDLTDQEKVLARLSLIRKQAGPAVGDLDRTADSNANQLRKLQGELDNAVVDFGTKLQDALRDGISLAHELGQAIVNATGKDVAANVGELTRAGINVARAAVTSGVTVGDLADAAIVATTQGEGTEEAKGRLQQKMADVMGLDINGAAGIPWMKTPQLAAGHKLAQQQADQAKALAARDARDQALADARIEREAEAKKIGGLVAQDTAAGLLGAVGLGGTGLQAMAGGGLPGALNQAAGDAAREREAEANRHNREVDRKQAEEENKPRFDSQQFSSGGDFASFAIQKALSDPEETGKKQVAELEKVGLGIEQLRELGQQFLQMVTTAPALRLILRGDA